jgi:hypothetical protein
VAPRQPFSSPALGADVRRFQLPKLLLGAIDDWVCTISFNATVVPQLMFLGQYDELKDEAEKANDTLDLEQSPNEDEAKEEEVADEGDNGDEDD